MRSASTLSPPDRMSRRCTGWSGGAGRLAWAGFLAGLLSLASVASARSLALPDFTGLVEASTPAVVNISTMTHSKDKGTGSFGLPHGMDPSMEDLLRRFFGGRGHGTVPAPHGDQESLGSGFIISPDGYILTNTHVVKGADEVIVRLSDRREFQAKVVGSDDRSDVALLKIDAEGLPVARIGHSAGVRVGSWVLAIGSPFGFDHSVTAGIVSAIGRSLPNENYTPFIQTDVAINPGNSGGPLYNLDGEVIGINSQIYSRTGGYMGVSFAIPIDLAMNVVEQIKETGHVSRGWLGVLIQDVTRELAESFSMDKPVGALVSRVLPDSPAEKAGLKVGDIIVAYNGHEIGRSSDLPPLVGSSRVGSRGRLEIIRDGKSRSIEVVLSELPADDNAILAAAEPGKRSIARLGLKVSTLDSDQKERLSVSGGVYVDEVDEGPAAKAGIVAGDVLLKINNDDITGVTQLADLVAGLDADRPVRVLVQRRGSPRFLALRLDE